MKPQTSNKKLEDGEVTPSYECEDHSGKLTLPLLVAATCASCAGFIFSYDLAISGPVLSFSTFQEEFFPELVGPHEGTSVWCQYDDQLASLFTSTAYIGAFIAFLYPSPWVARRFGLHMALLLEGILAMLGSGLMAGAYNSAMLYSGRAILGFGIGLGAQNAPIYLGEMSPAKYRGAFLFSFQAMGAIGGVVAQLVVNYGKDLSWNWRLALGMTAVPGAILFIGMLFLPDSPSSLAARGHTAEAEKTLRRIRGVEDVSTEFNAILDASNSMKSSSEEDAMRSFVTASWHRPVLIISIMLGSMLNLYGNVTVGSYFPELMRSIGVSESTSLRYNLIIALSKLICAVAGMLIVDRVGNRPLILVGCIDMGVTMFTIAGITGVAVKNGEAVPYWVSTAILVCMCVFQIGYEGSVAPLTFALPCELSMLQVREPAMGVTVGCAMLVNIAMAQAALAMLCTMEYGTFIFSGVWCTVMLVFAYFCIPESEPGLELEEDRQKALWSQHRVWKKVWKPEEEVGASGKSINQLGINQRKNKVMSNKLQCTDP